MTKGKTLLKRSEVKKEFTWAIEDLYSTDELWEKDYNRLKEMIPQIDEYRGRLSESGKTLLDFLNLYCRLNVPMERIYVYESKYPEDTLIHIGNCQIRRRY